MYKILLFFIFSVSAATPTIASDQSEDNTMLYPINIEIKEVSNRAQEAQVRGHKIIIDQPKEFGADDTGPTPPELLAISYGSCVLSTIQLLAAQQKLDISDIKVSVTGTVDFSKAMGISDKNRAGFPSLTIKLSFKSSLTKEQKQKLIADVSRVGAAIDNIENTTPVKYVLEE